MVNPQNYAASAAFAGENRTAGAYLAETAPSRRAAAEQAKASSTASSSKDGGFIGFLKGLIDVINPLQHIPVISTIYRNLTGDEISPMARFAGDTLFGGPVGAAMAMANIATEEKTGKDIGANVLAMMDGKKDASDPGVMVAANQVNGAQIAQNEFDKTKIIWQDDAAKTMPAQIALSDQAFPSPANPTASRTSQGTGTRGQEPAEISHPGPVQMAKTDSPPAPDANPAAAAASDRISLMPSRSMSADLLKQIAPAGGDRISLPPEHLASTIKKKPEHLAAAVVQKNDAKLATASTDGQAVPKELVSLKMMEALDKYASLKRGNMGGGLSASF